MACARYCKLFQRHNVSRLHSIGIRNTWIIVKNNTGYKMMADITQPEKQTNSQAPIIQPGNQNSWPAEIGQYKVWLTDLEHSTSWFLLNKTSDQDCVIDVGHHIHYHIEGGTEEKLPIAL
mmetsp:Transcript_12020/g.10723  ORF Transcript_12020/g.10723 Transcript_12020/m.10723 type:complete len:120 (+) Transcript_12020:34-393(+)